MRTEPNLARYDTITSRAQYLQHQSLKQMCNSCRYDSKKLINFGCTVPCIIAFGSLLACLYIRKLRERLFIGKCHLMQSSVARHAGANAQLAHGYGQRLNRKAESRQRLQSPDLLMQQDSLSSALAILQSQMLSRSSEMT